MPYVYNELLFSHKKMKKGNLHTMMLQEYLKKG